MTQTPKPPKPDKTYDVINTIYIYIYIYTYIYIDLWKEQISRINDDSQ